MFSSNNFHRPDTINDTLYVITVVFNPIRYRSRWSLYKKFENYVLSNNQAHLVTIECSFGERSKVIEQQEGRHTVIHVNTSHELWVKENLINLAIQRLPEDWNYVSWCDSDITFSRPDWVGETLHQLQHYDFVQMWSKGYDLSPNYETLKEHRGFVYCYKNGIPNRNKRMRLPYYHDDGADGTYWHPGFAWASKKDALNKVGGLVDFTVLGGGDMFMAYALVGQLNNRNMPWSLGATGVRWLYEWQNRAEKYIKRNIGYVEGTVLHYWHGKKVDRKYNDRGQILSKAKFNPELDLKRDWQGLYQLTDRSIELRDGIRQYFRNRNEDSIDI